MSDTDKTSTGMWAICELFGHRKLAGYLTEQELAGAGFLRLDVYPGDAVAPIATQLYSPRAFFGITPATETICRAFALNVKPQPVTQWELPQLGGGQDDADPADGAEVFDQDY